MSAWTEAELASVGGGEELQIASTRSDGSLRPYVTIWVARVGDELYVRSAYGSDNPWFRRARAAGIERDVTFGAAPAEVQAAIDAAYHAKYGRHGLSRPGEVGGS